jgi:hypothetical protein
VCVWTQVIEALGVKHVPPDARADVELAHLGARGAAPRA